MCDSNPTSILLCSPSLSMRPFPWDTARRLRPLSTTRRIPQKISPVKYKAMTKYRGQNIAKHKCIVILSSLNYRNDKILPMKHVKS